MTHLIVPGDTITRLEVIRSLPPGSVVFTPDEARYGWVRNPDGRWDGLDHNLGSHTSDENLTGVILAHAGGGSDLVQAETYDRYRWRWRDVTRTQSQRHGTGLQDVDRVIDRFHLDNSDGSFPFGTGMRIEDPSVRETLPEGSTVYLGDPEDYGSFGLFVYEQQRWHHLLGSYRDLHTGFTGRTTVDTVAGEEVLQPWLTAPKEPQDDILIARFKAVMWRIALKAKASHQWCDSLNNIMKMSNVGADTATQWESLPFAVGQRVTPEQCAALAEGTVLMYEGQRHRSYFVRHDSPIHATNRARTTLLFSTNPSGLRVGNWSVTMQVCGWPGLHHDKELGDLGALWEHLPPGTVFHARNNPAEFYAKTPGGRIAYIGGPSTPNPDSLGTGDWSQDHFTHWDRMRAVWIPGSPPPPSGTAQQAALDEIERELRGVTRAEPAEAEGF